MDILKAITSNGANKILPEPSTEQSTGCAYRVDSKDYVCMMSGQASSYTEALQAIERWIEDIDAEYTDISHISIKAI